jgi:hypothetical protein
MTTNGYKVTDLDKTRGPIKAGFFADLIAVNDRRPGDPALLDPLTQRRVRVVPVVAQIANDRKARVEHLDAVRHRLNRAQRGRVHHVGEVVEIVLGIRFVRECQMVVRVDETGQNGHLR